MVLMNRETFSHPITMADLIDWIVTSHLDETGGYPYDYSEQSDMLLVAALDPGKDYNATMLVEYPKPFLDEWLREANAWWGITCPERPFSEMAERDMNGALHECRPDMDGFYD